MPLRFLALVMLAGLLWPSSTSAQSYVQLPGGGTITDITPDGSIVVGRGTNGPFFWRWRVDPTPTWIGGVNATAVSEDGSVIVGSMIDPSLNDTVPGRWTAATGWLSLGHLPNSLSCPGYGGASDVSADGSVVVGLSWDGCNGRGFRWTQATGMQELMKLGLGQNNARALSGDGSVVAGSALGNSGSTPAYWNADTTGALLNPAFQGTVYGLDEDGGTSVGTIFLGNPNGFYSAFVRDASSGVITNLGALNPGQMAASARDISGDGNTIVGYDYFGLSREAWVWTSTDGIVSLNDRLAAAGVTGVPALFTCEAVSEDGSVVVGIGEPGIATGYIADLTGGDDAFVNIGGGAPGIDGIPLLAGTGSLVGGTPAGLELTHARDSTLTVAWVSLNPTPFAALGGTIHAFPYNNQFLFNTSPTGTLSLNTTWPVGLPAGVQAYFQFLIADSSSIHGIVPSNALRATTP